MCNKALGPMWDVMSDVVRWPDILPTVSAVRPLGQSRTLAVGARFAVRQPRLGPAAYVVTELEPGRSFTWASTMPLLTTMARHRLTPRGDMTVLELEVEWSGALAPFVRRIYRRLTERYLCAEAEAFERLAQPVSAT